MIKILRVVSILIILNIILSAKLPLVLLKSDKTTIKSGEELRIILSAKTKKESNVVFPDLKDIAGYGINDKRFTEISSKGLINNKPTTLSIKSVVYHITPTKSFTIPAYAIKIDGKTYKTKPLKIRVKAPKKRKNNSGFIFRMTASKNIVSVGEPFIVNVELIEPIKYGDATFEYKQPDFKGFKVVGLGDPGEIEQGDAVIKTLSYMLIPTKPGKFVIPKAKIRISLQMAPAMQTPFDFIGTTVQFKNLVSNSLEIKVLDIPKGVDIVGSYKIDATVDKLTTKPNKPVKLTLAIHGEGLLDDIKDPKINLDQVNVYGEDSDIIHKSDRGKIYSKYVKNYVFISNKDFIIPSIKVKAYNPKTKQIYLLATKPIKIKVKSSSTIMSVLNNVIGNSNSDTKVKTTKIVYKNSSSSANKTENTPKEQIVVSKKVEKIEEILIDKNYYKKRYSKNINVWYLVAIFIVGLIVGAILILLLPKYIKNRLKGNSENRLYGSYQEALNILYPHINKDKKIEEMVKLLYEVVNGNKEIKINEKALRKMVKKVKKKS